MKFRFVLMVIYLGLLGNFSNAAETTGRAFNFRIMPIGMFLGEFMGDFNFSPISFLEIGAIGYHVNGKMNESSIKGSGAGGRLSIHFSTTRNDDCWFLSAYYYNVRNAEITIGQRLTKEPVSEGGMLIGKMWVYNSGFNMSLALGLRSFKPAYFSDENGNLYTSASAAKIEYSLGWAF